MPPSLALTACCTPADLGWPSPTPPENALPGAPVKFPPPAAVMYFWKLSVVPDSSDRKKTLMALLGRVSEEFMSLMAWSSHLVILPVKILAMVGPSSTRPLMPDRLYATA